MRALPRRRRRADRRHATTASVATVRAGQRLRARRARVPAHRRGHRAGHQLRPRPVGPRRRSAAGGTGMVEDNVVQEIDVKTGAVLFEWHTLGTIPLGESYRPAPTEARADARPVPPQLGRGRRRTATCMRLAPATRARSTRSTARTGAVAVAARRQAQRLRDGTRRDVQAPARRAACDPTARSRCSTTSPRTLPARGRGRAASRSRLDRAGAGRRRWSE